MYTKPYLFLFFMFVSFKTLSQIEVNVDFLVVDDLTEAAVSNAQIYLKSGTYVGTELVLCERCQFLITVATSGSQRI